jgi:hypothetical protein
MALAAQLHSLPLSSKDHKEITHSPERLLPALRDWIVEPSPQAASTLSLAAAIPDSLGLASE